MGINFNALPAEKPAMGGSMIPKGQYIATIEKAEMKQGQDASRPPYLNLQLDIMDEASEAKLGKVFHILTESNHPLPMFQLKRIIEALNLPITGEFELKDLAKMIQGKKIKVDVAPEKAEEGKVATRSVVDVFSGQIFYPYTVNESSLDTDIFVANGTSAPVTASDY